MQVSNSFDGSDDYYLQYKAESGVAPPANNQVTLTKADGYWEEIARPYEAYNPNNGYPSSHGYCDEGVINN